MPREDELPQRTRPWMCDCCQELKQAWQQSAEVGKEEWCECCVESFAEKCGQCETLCDADNLKIDLCPDCYEDDTE